MWLLLEAAPTNDPLGFIQYGILGIILMLILTGYLWPKPAVDELKKNHELERQEWNDILKPSLVTMLAEVKEANAAIKVAANEIAETNRLLERRP
jgi:hypothetical protein